MASKGIVADLNKGEKLDGENYNIWHHKIQYVLNEQEVLETLTHSLGKPNEGSTEQHQRDLAANESWHKNDLCMRFTMLSSMHNDLIGKFEQYTTVQDMWKALKLRYEGTSATILHGLTMKFDSYKMHSEHMMKQHLRAMSSMIRKLKSAGNNLTDKQQVQAVIRSLPSSWETMCQNLTHNENIKTFDDVTHHLELEAKRLEAAKPISSVHMAETSLRKASRPKRKQPNYALGQERPNGPPPKKAKFVKRNTRGKHAKKDKSKLTCYNCRKK